MDEDGFSDSLWATTAAPPAQCPSLIDRGEAEILIIGGGFTGLSAALHLAERGIDVCLLEAQEPGWGASGRNGGQVIAGLKHDFKTLEAAWGGPQAERAIAFADRTADFTFGLIARLGLPCGAHRGGWVQGAHGPTPLAELARRVDALQKRGQDVVLLNRAEAEIWTGTDFYIGGVLDRRGGTVQPLSYARGLARAAIAAGARLHGKSPVTGLRHEAGRWVATTGSGGTLLAEKVLICTNGYTDLAAIARPLQQTVIPFYSYQIATAPLPKSMLTALPKQGVGVSETRRLLSYYRIDEEGRFVIGARGAMDGRLTDSAFRMTEQRLSHLFPQLSGANWQYRWNGRVAITPDYLPRLTDHGAGLYSAMGWNGRGVAITGAMGPVLADWISGQAGADELPFPVHRQAQRIPLHGVRHPAAGLLTIWKDLCDRWEARNS